MREEYVTNLKANGKFCVSLKKLLDTVRNIGVFIYFCSLNYQSKNVKPTMIANPIKVKALDDYTIFIWFSDGVQGSVDLKHLAHKGIFREWDKNNLFAQVHIDDYGAIAWNDDIDICPDSVYLQLKGLTFEQWQKQKQNQYATNQ